MNGLILYNKTMTKYKTLTHIKNNNGQRTTTLEWTAKEERERVASFKFSSWCRVAVNVLWKVKMRQKSEICTIKRHIWPRIPNGKMTKTQLNITNKSQEVSPFPAGDHKAVINRQESMTNTRHKWLFFIPNTIWIKYLTRYFTSIMTISSWTNFICNV